MNYEKVVGTADFDSGSFWICWSGSGCAEEY